MKLHIEWLQSALDELSKIWTEAPSSVRKAITAASHDIDKHLPNRPDEQGESRPDGRRIAFFPPLGITYRVEVQSSVVIVIHVWRFHQHGE